MHKEKFDDYKESSRGLNRHYKETFDSGGRKFRKEPYEEPTLSWNMWNQLKRISIPVFNGDRRAYEGWKAAFMACVHQAPATPDYKLLQLRQHLSGEALKIVEPFGPHLTKNYFNSGSIYQEKPLRSWNLLDHT